MTYIEYLGGLAFFSLVYLTWVKGWHDKHVILSTNAKGTNRKHHKKWWHIAATVLMGIAIFYSQLMFMAIPEFTFTVKWGWYAFFILTFMFAFSIRWVTFDSLINKLMKYPEGTYRNWLDKQAIWKRVILLMIVILLLYLLKAFFVTIF